MDIQTRDGILLRNIPDGTPDEAIKERIAQIRAGGPRKPQPTPEFEREAAEMASTTPAELIAGSAPGRFALGAASPFLGLAQLTARNPVSKALGQDKWLDEKLREVEELKKRGMKAYGNDPVSEAVGLKPTTDVVGTGGAVMSPAALAAMKLPMAATAGGRIGQGVALGTAAGATTPVTEGDNFEGSKSAQAVTGALLGGLIPGGIELGKKAISVGRNVIDPWLPGGVERAVGRTANAAAGDKRAAVIEALEKNEQIVPGSRPTAGEAAAPAGSAEFAGLQRVVEGRRPSAYFDRASEQEGARLGAITAIGKDKAALADAVKDRTKAAGPLYKSAREAGDVVDTSAVVAHIDDVLKKNPGNRALVSELTAVRKNLHDGKELRTNAQQVASVLDDLKASLANEDNKFIRGNLNDLKTAIADAIPGYQKAQRTFADASKPINRMQVGQELEKALTAPLGTAERPAAFAGAVREAPRTIKKATGQPRFDELSEVLTPGETQAVTNVLADLKRSGQHEQLAKAGVEKARALVGQVAPTAPAAGMFSPHYSVARAIANRFAGRVEGKSLDRLSEAMENPELMARIMKAASPTQRQAIVQALLAQKVGRGAVIGGTMGAAQQEQF